MWITWETQHMKQRRRQAVVLISSFLVQLAAAALARGQTGATGGEWRTYGGDLANTRYAPLAQITRDNFNKRVREEDEGGRLLRRLQQQMNRGGGGGGTGGSGTPPAGGVHP